MIKPGFIYLLHCSNNDTYKIGVSKKPQERVKKLQTGNPNIITLVDSYKCEQYFKVEKTLHKKYNTNKTESENEWMYLTEEQVKNFKIDCEEICENMTYIFKNNPYL